MKELIIHAGRHKTGTTSIQRFLALNYSKLLSEHNLLYPVTGRDRYYEYHHQLFEQLVTSHKGMDANLTELLNLEIDAKSPDRVIVSSEILSRTSVTENKLEKIKKAFSDFTVIIVIYLRRQDSYLRSEYAERVKRGLLFSPDTIYDLDVELDYYKFIEKFSRVFGRECIRVRVFEDAVKIGIYNDLLSTLNIELNSGFELPKKIYNRRWPWLLVEVVRRLGPKSFFRKLITRQKIVRIILYLNYYFPSLFEKYEPLTDAECAEIMNKYHPSNQKLATEYLNRKDIFNTN